MALVELELRDIIQWVGVALVELEGHYSVSGCGFSGAGGTLFSGWVWL